MFEIIKNALKAMWNSIKKIFEKVLNFFRNIAGFFKDPQRLKKIQQNKNLIAVAVKENLANGNYNVINCLFDKETESINKEDSIIIEAQDLDEQTKNKFENKDMIVLQ